MGLADAVRESRRSGLEALRDTLAQAIEAGDVPPQGLAVAAKQLAELMRDLESLSEGRRSKVDDLARRRAERLARAAAAGSGT